MLTLNVNPREIVKIIRSSFSGESWPKPKEAVWERMPLLVCWLTYPPIIIALIMRMMNTNPFLESFQSSEN